LLVVVQFLLLESIMGAAVGLVPSLPKLSGKPMFHEVL